MAEFITVAEVGSIPPGEMREVRVEGTPVVLANVDGQVYAFGGRCTHVPALLGAGWLLGYTVECPFHGGQFDIRTGEPLAFPCTEPIPVFEVRVEGNDIKIKWP